MSLSQDRLFVLWHDRKGGFFFPIAQLERRPQSPRYVFGYLPAFRDAYEHGLEPLLAFPDVAKVYKSDLLFPFFENRLMRKSRPDYNEYLQSLALDPTTADEMAILGRSGGERATDAFLLMPDLTPLSAGRYELFFWAGVLVTTEALLHLSKLEPETLLELSEQGQLSHDGFPVGRLPDHIRVFFPKSEPTSQSPSPSMKPEIRVVRRNSGNTRYMLLCRLVLWGDNRLKFADMGGIPEEPAQKDARLQRPRAFVGERLSQDLENLIDRLAEGDLPEPLHFARPIGGFLLDKPLTDPEMELEWSHEPCRLVVSGSASSLHFGFFPVDLSRPHETHLDLQDGSTIYAHGAGSFGMGARWWCELSGWHWTAPENTGGSVRYWVGLLEDSSLEFPWMNLGVTTNNSVGLRGLHVDGTPSLTLLLIDKRERSDSQRSKIAVVVQASEFEQDIERNLYRATNLLAAVTGISEPPMFYGYDDELILRACCARGRKESDRHTYWLPVLPLAADRHRSDLRWPVPFLRCLRDKVFAKPTRDGLHEALVWFRFVLEEPYWEGQLAKIGVALRMLLLWSNGISTAELLDPERVNQAMQRLAERHGLALPEGASAAVALSYRVALLGDRGVPPFWDNAQSFLAEGQWIQVQDTLRTTFATLLAGLIKYYGPVVGRLHTIRSFSQGHNPRFSLDKEGERERATQEAAARATYVAGDPDSFPF